MDSTDPSVVERQSRNQRFSYSASEIVSNFNKYLQGVDRVDQLRARFFIADGHPFKKRYLKLAAGIIDLARVNAYTARSSTIPNNNLGDPHQQFVSNLAAQLIRGQ